MADTERAESSQLDPVAAHQGFGHFFQDGIDDPFGILQTQKGSAMCEDLNKFGFDHVAIYGSAKLMFVKIGNQGGVGRNCEGYRRLIEGLS